MYWETTIDSRSRLIMNNGNGKVYESDNGLSTLHKVDIYDLKSSTKYDYKITATTEDKKGYDDYYSSFTAFMEYVISLEKIDEECTNIVIKDTTGKPVKGMFLTIKGINKRINSSGQNYVSYKKEISEKTNNDGKIKYCDSANHFEIYGEGVEHTYLELKVDNASQQTNQSSASGGLIIPYHGGIIMP